MNVDYKKSKRSVSICEGRTKTLKEEKEKTSQDRSLSLSTNTNTVRNRKESFIDPALNFARRISMKITGHRGQ